jgi:hypothetical protein
MSRQKGWRCRGLTTTVYPSASTWRTIVRMLGRRGLYSTSICAPRGSKSVRVHLVLGRNYFCDGRQRRRNVERGEALLQARANLLVMGGVRCLQANLLKCY